MYIYIYIWLKLDEKILLSSVHQFVMVCTIKRLKSVYLTLKFIIMTV